MSFFCDSKKNEKPEKMYSKFGQKTAKNKNKHNNNGDDNYDKVGKDDVFLKNKSTFHFDDASSL